MERSFSVDEARAMLPALLAKADELIVLRADLVELGSALSAGHSSALGGVPEAKAMEARFHELLDWFSQQGLQVKGFAPLLLDFPGELDGEPALLCWLEGDRELNWWHRPEHGFAGRRPLPLPLAP